MKKVILLIFIISSASIFANKSHIKKGIQFCKNGETDSALYYFNIVSDEITIETSEEDIFNKFYYSAKCYDEINANKSAEFYYMKAVKMMDTIEVNEPELFKDISSFFEEINNYKGANEYLHLYYDESMMMMNEESNIANERLERLDSLEARLETIDNNKLKADGDMRLLTVLIVVFGSGFFVILFLFLRQKKTLANS